MLRERAVGDEGGVRRGQMGGEGRWEVMRHMLFEINAPQLHAQAMQQIKWNDREKGCRESFPKFCLEKQCSAKMNYI